jgi:proline iminopeptidase
MHPFRGLATLLAVFLMQCSAFQPSSSLRHISLFHRKEETFQHASTNDVISEVDHHDKTFSNLNRTLYPPATLQRNGTLKVDSIHTIYFEVYGKGNNAQKTRRRTAISLHGGPGAGSFPRHAQFFDPEKYDDIILFDQRGCGKSTPRGETKSNTLENLVHDIETLRIHLEIDQFDVMLGGSWGSTLALAYAQMFPPMVGSMVLRGVCLFRPEEIDWLFGNEKGFTPEEDASSTRTNCISNLNELSDAWKAFEEIVKKDENEEGTIGTRSSLINYYNNLLGNDPIARAIATKSWFRWEMGVSSFKNISSFDNWGDGEVGDLILWDPSKRQWQIQTGNFDEKALQSLRRWPQRAPFLHTSTVMDEHSTPLPVSTDDALSYDAKAENITSADAEKFVPAQTMLTCFYSVNDQYMMSKFQLLSRENMDKIRHIRCIAVQGAKDLICPPDSALDLSECWPEMECRIVTDGKHSMYDPLITSEIIRATDHLAEVV